MDAERWMAEAKEAAEDLRGRGDDVLPLDEAFYLTPERERLLKALVGLRILEPDEIPVSGSLRPAPAA